MGNDDRAGRLFQSRFNSAGSDCFALQISNVGAARVYPSRIRAYATLHSVVGRHRIPEDEIRAVRTRTIYQFSATTAVTAYYYCYSY